MTIGIPKTEAILEAVKEQGIPVKNIELYLDEAFAPKDNGSYTIQAKAATTFWHPRSAFLLFQNLSLGEARWLFTSFIYSRTTAGTAILPLTRNGMKTARHILTKTEWSGKEGAHVKTDTAVDDQPLMVCHGDNCEDACNACTNVLACSFEPDKHCAPT